MGRVGYEMRRLGLRKAYEYLDRDPERNLPNLIEWFDRYAPNGVLQKQRDLFRRIVTEREGNWYQLLISLWDDIDDEVRKTLFENLVINANALAAGIAAESRQKYGCNIPWAISIGLGKEGEEGRLGFDEWDDVIEQAKELGTFMFLFEGGDPLESKEELIALANKHFDCEFMIFTDGKRITEELAAEMLRVKNLIVVLRINGTPEDARLATPTEILRRNKLPFCTYSFYDESNAESFCSEEFYDILAENGVKMSFFFSSFPEDADPAYDVMVNVRRTKPIVPIHFCKDKDIIGGCVAGGRYYCSIDAKGNVEPCFFLRKSDTNVREKTLLEALQAPLCMKYHREEVPCNVEKKSR